jgi:hypothetical protein
MLHDVEQEHLSRGVYRGNYEGIREIARGIRLVVDQHLTSTMNDND